MDCRKIADFFKTLGHPTRLRIVRELAEGERCVGAVENCVGASQANVSQHLTVLKKQGIVACRKDGNLRCYYLTDPQLMRDVLTLLDEEKHNAEEDQR
ncbi:MAG: winged helix-turn-helix transcriptional regulator [Deltaproteobacteria bacterium]|nr:winged helix-turn-helix transcriptional regulator [Deltaproteobacteria bacterium]